MFAISDAASLAKFLEAIGCYEGYANIKDCEKIRDKMNDLVEEKGVKVIRHNG